MAVLRKSTDPDPLQSRTPRDYAKLHNLSIDAKPRKRDIAPVLPSAAIEEMYKRKLMRLIDQMQRSTVYWVKAEWRSNTPELAQDASPARTLGTAVRRLARRWQRQFNELADFLAAYFAADVSLRTDVALKRALKRGGMSVEFKLTPAQNDVLQSIIQENVSLIRSISQRYFTQVEGYVQRSVQTGRDLHQLTQDLQHNFGVTRRRAELIARDQNNKATAMLARVKQLDLGIKQARWVHSGAGKEPRPSHVKASRDKVIFDLAEGWYDPHEKKHILPGQLINCFPGSTLVNLDTIQVEHLWRSFFNGKVVNLGVGSNLLQSTPNHPILTRNGWCAADAIEVGDEVVCITAHDRFVIDDEEHKLVTSFDNLFKACSTIFGNVCISGSSFDFYGDVPDGEVYDVMIDYDLLRKLYVTFSEQGGKFLFPESYSWINSSICSSFNEIFDSDFSGLCDILSILFRSAIRRYESIGFDLRTDRHFTSFKNSLDMGSGYAILSSESRSPQSEGVAFSDGGLDLQRNMLDTFRHGSGWFGSYCGYGKSSFPKIPTDHISRKANSGGSVCESSPVSYELRRVIEKSVGYFSGHVYTMQSNLGYYAVGAEKIIAKNCRCTSSPIIPGFS